MIANPFTARDDLQLLVDHVESLKGMRRFSSGVVKLCSLCDVFVKVASLYVQAKDKEAGHLQHSGPAGGADYTGQPVLNDIDEYLSTLGFAPPSGTADGASNASSGDLDFDASFLVDWHAGNLTRAGADRRRRRALTHANTLYRTGSRME